MLSLTALVPRPRPAPSSRSEAMTVQTHRWLEDGHVDRSHVVTVVAIPTPAGATLNSARKWDSVILDNGKTLIAFALPPIASSAVPVAVVIRLRADGTLDTAFGDGGSTVLQGADYTQPIKLSVQQDGRILLAYTAQFGARFAVGTRYGLAVTRLMPEGSPDLTFTADGRFNSVFSLTASADSSADVAVVSDGRILASGASGGAGFLTRLRGAHVTAQPASVGVAEYINTGLEHFFITAGPGEIMSVDTGGAGPRWQRTGLGFRAYLPELGVPADALPVCRFYGTPGRGPNSHFYTVQQSECAAVMADPGWTYEGIAFYVYTPINGQCGSDQQPVFRVYNNGYPQNNSNHRYTTDPAIYASMQVQGWSPEGVVFCGPQGGS